MTLYFTWDGDGSWEIGDRGETVTTLIEVSDSAEAEIEAFRRGITRPTITLEAERHAAQPRTKLPDF